MADIADAADALDGRVPAGERRHLAHAARARARGDARGGRRRRLQQLPAAARPAVAARRDRRPLRAGLGRHVRPRARDRRLVRRRRVAAERAAGADRPRRPRPADQPDLLRDGAARPPRRRRAGLHLARRARRPLGARSRRPARAGARLPGAVLRLAVHAGRDGLHRARRPPRSWRAAQENDAWIVFNGAADKVAFGGRTVHNPATFPGMRERTLVVGCMSKNYAMPGWRIGWAAGPREVMGAMEDVHIFNGIMPSGIAQAGAAAALDRPAGAGRPRRCDTYARGQAALLEAVARLAAPVGDPGRGRLLLPARHRGHRRRRHRVRRAACSPRSDVAVTPMQGWGSRRLRRAPRPADLHQRAGGPAARGGPPDRAAFSASR